MLKYLDKIANLAEAKADTFDRGEVFYQDTITTANDNQIYQGKFLGRIRSEEQLAIAALRVGQMSHRRHNSLLLRNFATTFCPVRSIYRNLRSIDVYPLLLLDFQISI